MTGWLDFSPEASSTHPAEQSAFVQEVEELLDVAGTPGLDRAGAFAGRWTDDIFQGALLIVLPLISVPHASIQLQMRAAQILGTWDDKHYLWDITPEGGEALRVDGIDREARAQALDWLSREIRRPLTRRDYRWGRLRATTWSHTDDADYSWSDRQGLLLAQLHGTQCAEEPSGYLDPPRVT